MAIKIKLSEYLGRYRITQKELACRANIRPATVSAIYNEKCKRMDLDILNRMCAALNCQIGDLLEYIPDKE